MQERILHPSVYLKDRRHDIDLYVYEPCSLLWAAGIETFFSCQGGPQLIKGKIQQTKAMVVVRRKDGKKACKVLKHLNPKLDDNLLWKRIAIKFNASVAAQMIPMIVENTNISYEFLGY